MSDFTPGPWADRGTGCVGTTRQLIASVYPMEDERPEEHAANVRLIATTPDLLEALRSLLDALPSATTHPAIRRARAAIAKATGERL